MRAGLRTVIAGGILATFTAAQSLLTTYFVKQGAMTTQSCVDSGMRNIDDLLDLLATREPAVPGGERVLIQQRARMRSIRTGLQRIQWRLDDLGPDNRWSNINILTAPGLALQMLENNNTCVQLQYQLLAEYTIAAGYTRPKEVPDAHDR